VKIPEVERILTESQSGLLVKPDNHKDLQKQILLLMRNSVKTKTISQNGTQAVLNTYCWEKEEKKLFSIYKELI
jgi:hypothetical protein